MASLGKLRTATPLPRMVRVSPPERSEPFSPLERIGCPLIGGLPYGISGKADLAI